jgi:hypothetical protein
VHKVARPATAVTFAVGLLMVSIGSASADVKPIGGETGAGISVSSVSVSGGSGGGGSGGRPCTYRQANVPGDPSTELTITLDLAQQQGTKEGAWYFSACQDPQAPLGNRAGVIFVPAGQPAVPPAVLARQASRFVPAPPPGIQLNPPVGADHLVNLESWLWVDPATWGQRSATASVPNESATVVATPLSVTWMMGDGSKVVCRGPGVAYNLARPPDSQHTTCSHTYRRSSAGQLGARYTVSATTTWALSWTASGVVTASGTLPPLLRTSTTTVRVAEAQTLN